MAELVIPNITDAFNKKFSAMMDAVEHAKKGLGFAISTCQKPEKRRLFEELLSLINIQQSEIKRVIPPMVAENELAIRAGVKQLYSIKAQAENIGERIEELKKQADEARRQHEAREAERASQPAEPTALPASGRLPPPAYAARRSGRTQRDLRIHHPTGGACGHAGACRQAAGPAGHG